MNKQIAKLVLPKELKHLISRAMNITIPETRESLLEMAMGGKETSIFEVAYDVPGKGRFVEATVARCKNGAVVNYTDIYMRRRDPDCMIIADSGKSDKQRYQRRYGSDFDSLRHLTFEWLAEQNLIMMPFMAGGEELGYPALLVAPENAGFFAGGLADLQGFIPGSKITEGFKPRAIIYLAPTFRHTHFHGKQMVVHNRLDDIYELFSYNLYPGPSAKKGVYGVLIKIGEDEGWITAHGSTVKIITPYDNSITIMHEGASGGGKSEMIEEMHRELDGRILISKNLITQEKMYMELAETCELWPVTDDMALCHPQLQNESKKLVVTDAEQGWFLRTNHIKKYNTDPYLESMCIHPPEPLIFINYDAVPGSTCLLWEHIMDAPGKPCPNPRVIMPRRFVQNIVNQPTEVDVRSFGVRTPPCTKEHPTYGILGLFHILPPALAWLWRMVAPRGHDNPSITDTEGMSSEGVGSYWPFATGKQVDQANLMLNQILDTPNTRYMLVPNQHIGAHKVGFMPQWIAREYLARRGGARFRIDQIKESQCALLGYSLSGIKVEGFVLPKDLLEVNKQPEVGEEGFEAGAKILSDFFKRELPKFDAPALEPLGRQIIECCMSDGSVNDYVKLIPIRL
ncbi:MAG: DUF4914 domain-containing protein [Firmicutes bacterium HGW-Firmicutes-11]|jgi:hypothetical protein|nr:MAG: DUF4914 domain-containing protein [Firmicutes bacterium HGW-Firmicutes-11]